MRKLLILPSALIVAAGVATAGVALAQSGPTPPPLPPHHDWNGGDGRGHGGGMDRHGMRGHGMRGDPAMRLAKRLSAMETLIGIRSDQLDAWRAFTAASIDMVSRPPRPDKKPEPEAFGMADRIADMAIARAEKAKALKEATAALRQKLTPEQLERVKTVETEMRDRFMRRHGGWHGWGERGPRPGQDGPQQPDRQRL
jgi:Spy/CpxP family protein refolding chaperone